jgi:hypothetical protein
VRTGVDDFKWTGRKSKYRKLHAAAAKKAEDLADIGRKAGKMGKTEVSTAFRKNGPALAVGATAGLGVGGGLGSLVSSRKKK